MSLSDSRFFNGKHEVLIPAMDEKLNIFWSISAMILVISHFRVDNKSAEMPQNARLKLMGEIIKNPFNHLWFVINVAVVTLNMLCQQNIHFHFVCRRSCSSVFRSNISSENQFSFTPGMHTNLQL